MSPFSAKNGSSVSSASSAFTIAPPVPSGSVSVIHVIDGSPWRLDERVERVLEVRARQHDLVHGVTGQVVEHVVQARPVDERDERLRGASR